MFGFKNSKPRRLIDPKLQAAFDILPDAISFWDEQDRCVYWNAMYVEQIKHSGAQLRMGMPYVEMLQGSLDRGVFPEAVGREKEWLAERIAARRAGDKTFERKLFGERWWRFDERLTGGGGLLSTIVDISELKNKELEIERKNAETREASARIAAAAAEQTLVVDALAEGLEKLAAGELQFNLNHAFPTGYEKLRGDFNATMKRLHDTMTGIAVSARGVHDGSVEVSQAAEDLARRTERQAASLEETAAALDQITVGVRRTAAGASKSDVVAREAKVDAESSGEIVRSAVTAMSEIDTSAQKISQITNVVDEIAFQTNLLALNAGIEAARAGEAGRGFAVVATEVRALAQRSAAAAKEIKGLIVTSSAQVKSGVKMVGDAGAALDAIIAKVGEISALTAEIASSADEQARGLQQINNAITEVDRATQQNAAMVQESTAASFALASEAQKLSGMIGHFKIPADTEAARPDYASGLRRVS